LYSALSDPRSSDTLRALGMAFMNLRALDFEEAVARKLR
jgi:hypothetical protein